MCVPFASPFTRTQWNHRWMWIIEASAWITFRSRAQMGDKKKDDKGR